jgi:hypothetical protein
MSAGRFSSSLRIPNTPNIHTRFSQRMKCDLQPVFRHTDGDKLTRAAFRLSRQLGPVLLSRLMVSSSPHPQGHRKTAHLGTPRSTIAMVPLLRATNLAALMSAAATASSKARIELSLGTTVQQR